MGDPGAPFNLTRYFLLTSSVGLMVILVALVFLLRHLTFQAFEEYQTRETSALTDAFLHTIWPEYSSFILAAHSIAKTELPQRLEIAALREDVLRRLGPLKVAKVKIYDANGLTVFSTDPKQIGEDESRSPDFQRAQAGHTASYVTFRKHFIALDWVLTDRTLAAAYIPIRRTPASPIEGVLETYSDVTELIAKLQTTQWKIVSGILGGLSLFYLFLFFIVRRADRLIKADEAKILHQAYHDSLTGLPNRAYFLEFMDEALKLAGRSEAKCAVLGIDLDRFKDVNDSLGHLAGDRLLQQVGERLGSCLREGDIIARQGGDEFHIGIPGIKRVEQITSVAEKLLGEISRGVYPVDGHQLGVTASIGISVHPDDGDTVVELMKNADAAMYHAKQMGRNNCQFHTPEMNARAAAMLTMERALRQAIEREEFLLHYQPQVDIGTGEVTGAEALIRWLRPGTGLVPPAQFIPIAEERGLIAAIGNWGLREACRQNWEWQTAGLPRLRVAVNLSAHQFRQADLSGIVAQMLQESGLAPGHFELELTESAVMNDPESAVATMRRLKAIGVKLALDDFGTGHSSLSYLKRFPLDNLKIDQSFVRGLPSNPDDAAIVAAILGMAKALKLKTIAEGVENQEQMEFLRSLGCDEIQGYYVSRPLPADAFVRFLQNPGLFQRWGTSASAPALSRS